jgi:hypothetical protein
MLAEDKAKQCSQCGKRRIKGLTLDCEHLFCLDCLRVEVSKNEEKAMLLD